MTRRINNIARTPLISFMLAWWFLVHSDHGVPPVIQSGPYSSQEICAEAEHSTSPLDCRFFPQDRRKACEEGLGSNGGGFNPQLYEFSVIKECFEIK